MFRHFPGEQTQRGHSRNKEIKVWERTLCQDIHNNIHKCFSIGGGGNKWQEDKHPAGGAEQQNQIYYTLIWANTI